MNHEKILNIATEITDRFLLIMNEIPDGYKNNYLLKKLAYSSLMFTSFAAFVADDIDGVKNE